jgi:hypothetical protein
MKVGLSFHHVALTSLTENSKLVEQIFITSGSGGQFAIQKFKDQDI